MIRTAPALPAQPDAIRAMTRLEAQLRRASDDLAESLAELRKMEHEPERFRGVARPPKPLCKRYMPHSQAQCARYEGHRDSCRTRKAMDADKRKSLARRTA
jgi:hypothetical protein